MLEIIRKFKNGQKVEPKQNGLFNADQKLSLTSKLYPMPRFALRFPYLIIVICLITCVVGVNCVTRMPVDLFPPIKIPVVVAATFFNGMPPEQIETDITGRF